MGYDEKEASETAAEAVRIQEEDTDRIQESEIKEHDGSVSPKEGSHTLNEAEHREYLKKTYPNSPELLEQ